MGAGTTILCGPFQGSQVLEMWQKGKIDGMRLVAGTQGGDGGWLPPREWDLERPAMDLLPTSLMCPVEELLARAVAGEELRPFTPQDVEQASQGLAM
ncbi:hypothetical protein DUNSADRAFT_2592 [Dunaliella salina]|uniref:Uncharacterized protein n=1 Tax=Dunaliella salina TaxID=3046 RepID=A0ABQ7FW47_DUNSA|nr:hypothetical protein DUNSADRAFT_2592 [Dunaliella salina]|eukprot:KAF5826591.1 hypothetical protein DUNSADRAFT_2592 [Dunaliella salina]